MTVEKFCEDVTKYLDKRSIPGAPMDQYAYKAIQIIQRQQSALKELSQLGGGRSEGNAIAEHALGVCDRIAGGEK